MFAPSTLASESRLLVTARRRPGAAADWLLPLDEPEPEVGSLVALAKRARQPGQLWLFGGEPTLRADLPLLIREVRAALGVGIGLRTDGLAFRSAEHARPLLEAGVVRLRIRLDSARFDAHDWVSGMRGSGLRALAALRLFSQLHVPVEVETWVTRPTAPYLSELVELLQPLRVAAFHFCRWVLTPELADRGIELGPRLGLVEPYLEQAVALATAQRCQVWLHGFPSCAVGRALAAQATRSDWLVPEAWPIASVRESEPDAAVRCHACGPECGGAPKDYVARFGAAEFASERLAARPAQVVKSVAATDSFAAAAGAGVVPAPPARGLRSPATRLRVVRRQAEAPTLDGDPIEVAAAAAPIEVLRVRWSAPSRLVPTLADNSDLRLPEHTRGIRQRLVQASQYGARYLRVVGDSILLHPARDDLLAELPRLSIPMLELCTEGSLLAELPEASFAMLSCFHRIDVPLFSADPAGHNARVLESDAFAKTLEGVARARALGPGTVRVFGVVANASEASAFSDAWAAGRLPGEPNFRLGARGASLDELAHLAQRLGTSSAGRALAMLLPAYLRREGEAAHDTDVIGLEQGASVVATAASSCDRLGDYRACDCMLPGCPGIPSGWATKRVEAQ